jgi:replication-associated recombination protein RarA
MGYQIETKRGYDFYEVSSSLQKSIRRGDARHAGYWAIELWESGYANYVWKRLYTISAEDVWGLITNEVRALHQGYLLVNEAAKKQGEKKPAKGRIFIAKAVIMLCMAKKSRDADHLTNLVYDRMGIDEKKLQEDLEEARKHPEPIPPYAFDIHTAQGRARGATKAKFFVDEHDALDPFQPGLFDDDLSKVRHHGLQSH